MVRVNHLVNAGPVRYMLSDRCVTSRYTATPQLCGHCKKAGEKDRAMASIHLVASAIKFSLLQYGSFVAFICKSAISSKHRSEVTP